MMPKPDSRYDKHADWYFDYTADWESASADFLPGDLVGSRILDLACGYGQLSRTLAERGAIVTGVDLSIRFIERARQIEAERQQGISYLIGHAGATDWWDGTRFDGVVCNMALMDIDDLGGALTTVSSVLDPGAWFSFTLLHPCFPGDPKDPNSLSSWPPDRGYSAEGWWTTEQSGVRGHVGAQHRMLSSYLNAVIKAGFEFERFDEAAGLLPRVFRAVCRRS
jgi:SAM-dependent methyltransferase